MNFANFLRAAFSIEHLRWLLLFLIEREEEKSMEKGGGTIFQMKEKNENVSFNFCLQVSVLVKTEIQVQLCKKLELLKLFHLLFLQIFFLLIPPVCSFFVFSFLTNLNLSCCIY